MRVTFLLMCILLFSQSGYAMFIKSSGVRLDDLENRGSVHKEFGIPVQLGRVENLQTEEYLTHKKISEVQSGMVLLAYLYTLGLYDLYAAPLEAYESLQKTIRGQRIKVYYDSDGIIQRIEVDGCRSLSSLRYNKNISQSDKQ